MGYVKKIDYQLQLHMPSSCDNICNPRRTGKAIVNNYNKIWIRV